MTQLFCPDSGSFELSLYHLGSSTSSGDASLPLTADPWTVLHPVELVVKYFNATLVGVLCFSHLLQLESEFMFAALCLHFMYS